MYSALLGWMIYTVGTIHVDIYIFKCGIYEIAQTIYV